MPVEVFGSVNLLGGRGQSRESVWKEEEFVEDRTGRDQWVVDDV